MPDCWKSYFLFEPSCSNCIDSNQLTLKPKKLEMLVSRFLFGLGKDTCVAFAHLTKAHCPGGRRRLKSSTHFFNQAECLRVYQPKGISGFNKDNLESNGITGL